MNTKQINNIRVYAPKARKELIDFALEQKKILVAINAEKILNAPHEIKALINDNIGYPDGIGAVWALQKKGAKEAVKIPGCELWLDIIAQSYREKTFYLVGGKEEVIQQTVAQLKQQFKGINIVNYRNGYIKSEQEQNELIEDIKKHQPDVVFVAMGSPKQEYLMLAMQKEHKAVYQGLGGSFDVYVGAVERAPEWWIRNNLEWAYRLVKQPRRIGRQLKLVKFYVLLKLGRF